VAALEVLDQVNVIEAREVHLDVWGVIVSAFVVAPVDGTPLQSDGPSMRRVSTATIMTVGTCPVPQLSRSSVRG
jgi:hypothetical protein